MLSERAGIGRVLLPPDAPTTVLALAEAIGGTGQVVAVVASSQPGPTYFSPDGAARHLAAGIWAIGDEGPAEETRPVDAVLCGISTVPMREAHCASRMLARDAPELRVRVLNVMDLEVLAPPEGHERGLSTGRFAELFGDAGRVVMAFHGYAMTLRALLFGWPRR